MFTIASTGSMFSAQVENLTLISPITGKTFPVTAPTIDVMRGKITGDNDMGTDIDGCRHTAGISEYDLFIVVDPTSYFAAQVAEFQRDSGRFGYPLTTEFKEWVLKELNIDLVTDRNQALRSAQNAANQTGKPIDPVAFQLGQDDITTSRRYDLALRCYRERRTRDLTLARISLMGSWAMRVYLNRPILDNRLSGAVGEINDKLDRRIKDEKRGDIFDPEKVMLEYAEIRNESLTKEAKFLADLTYFGLLLRDGNFSKVKALITEMKATYRDDDKPLMPGLIRNRESQLEKYFYFTRIAALGFAGAVQAEDVNRRTLPSIMFATAEAYRRINDLDRARDWYYALTQMPEGQPVTRGILRGQGRKTPPDSGNQAMQVAWLAEDQLRKLVGPSGAMPTAMSSGDRNLLSEVVLRNLGHSTYVSPTWKPRTGAPAGEVEAVMKLIFGGLFDVAKMKDVWPATLGELWDMGAIIDQQRVNRFHDPFSGQPFSYVQPKERLGSGFFNPRLVMLATATAVPMATGNPKFAMHLINGQVVWSEKLTPPGQILPP